MTKNQKGSSLLLYLLVLQSMIVFGGFCFDGLRLIYADIILNGSVRHAAISASTALLQSEELAVEMAEDVLKRNCKDAYLLEVVPENNGITVSAELQIKLYFIPVLTDTTEKTMLASYTAY